MSKISKKILIVEDDKDLLFIFQIRLTEEGFSVITAENGRDGLTAIDNDHPDLILLDILMPVMDGIEMAKQMNSRNLKIPVIFLTNLNDVEHVADALKAIPSDYIIKADTPPDKIVTLVKQKLGLS